MHANHTILVTGATGTIGRPLVDLLVGEGAQIRAGDVVGGPYAAFAEAPIHERDLAEIGARALLSAALVGRKLELTGPQSLTHAEMVATIGAVLGRPLRYQEIPPEAAKRGMVEQGFPEPFVEALLARYARGVGQAAPLTCEVESVLGRPARTFAAWVADHAAAFRNGGPGTRRMTGRVEPAVQLPIKQRSG